MKEFVAWLTINRNCNLHCMWCYQRKLANSTQKMDKQLAFQLIDLLAGLPVKFVVIMGGEPTLHPDFFDIVEYIKEKGLVANVVSNSIRFADDTFVSIAETAGLHGVTTSLKGSSEEEYLMSAGLCAFYSTRKAIENLEASRLKHRISVTVSGPIIANWQRMIGFVRSCKAKDFIFSFEKPTILGDDITFDDQMMPRRVADFIERVMYPSLSGSEFKFKIEFVYPHCVFSDGFVERLETEGCAFGGCVLLKQNGIVFDTEGQVLPCNHFVTQPLGKFGMDFNTPNEFLKWRKNGMRQLFQIAGCAPDERCVTCDKWSRCGAGCRIFWLYRGANELLPFLA